MEKGADTVDGFWRVGQRFMYLLVSLSLIRCVKPENLMEIRSEKDYSLAHPFPRLTLAARTA